MEGHWNIDQILARIERAQVLFPAELDALRAALTRAEQRIGEIERQYDMQREEFEAMVNLAGEYKDRIAAQDAEIAALKRAVAHKNAGLEGIISALETEFTGFNTTLLRALLTNPSPWPAESGDMGRLPAFTPPTTK